MSSTYSVIHRSQQTK